MDGWAGHQATPGDPKVYGLWRDAGQRPFSTHENGLLPYYLRVAVLSVRVQTEFDDDLSICDDPVMSVWVAGHRNTAASVRTVRANSPPRGVRRVQLSVATAEPDPLRRLHLPNASIATSRPVLAEKKSRPGRETSLGVGEPARYPSPGPPQLPFPDVVMPAVNPVAWASACVIPKLNAP